MRRQLGITFILAGEPLDSVTHLVRSGPYVLVMHTVMPQRGLAVELHSTFVGHNAAPTHATHLLLGPVGHLPRVTTRDDASDIVDPFNRPNSCVYAHCHELVDLLAERGLNVTIDQLPAQPVPLSQ